MFAENRKISLRQLQVLLLLDSFGTAVLFLPAELAQIGGHSCWILALVGGLFFGAVCWLLSSVGSRMPAGTVVEWYQTAFGKWLGGVVLLGLAVHLVFIGTLELRLFSEVVCRAMLPRTPVWVLSLVILAVAGALAAQGTECRGRTAEILFFAVFLPLVIILLAVAATSQYNRVLPLQLPSVSAIGNGISAMSVVFQGLIFLYFIFPDLRKPVQAKGAAVKSSLLLAALVTVIVFLCLASYGESVLSEKLLPTLQMMERVSFSGIFLTRQDLLLLWFWMASGCVFLSGVVFYGSLLAVRICGQAETKRQCWLWVWLLVLFAASFLPENLSAAYQLRLRFLPWSNLFFLVILPLILRLKRGRRDV